MKIVDAFIGELEREAETTKRVLARVPNEKMIWQPHPSGVAVDGAGVDGGGAVVCNWIGGMGAPSDDKADIRRRPLPRSSAVGACDRRAKNSDGVCAPSHTLAHIFGTRPGIGLRLGHRPRGRG